MTRIIKFCCCTSSFSRSDSSVTTFVRRSLQSYPSSFELTILFEKKKKHEKYFYHNMWRQKNKKFPKQFLVLGLIGISLWSSYPVCYLRVRLTDLRLSLAFFYLVSCFRISSSSVSLLTFYELSSSLSVQTNPSFSRV